MKRRHDRWVRSAAALMLVAGCSRGVGRRLAEPAEPTTSPSMTPPGRTLEPRSDCSDATTGTMRVCPASGPVGTTVTVEGIHCGVSAGGDIVLVFMNDGFRPGTKGAMELPVTSETADGYFSLTWTSPTELHRLQDGGGGAIVPGEYFFTQKPMVCDGASFTVVS